jgi:hypothetical protein
MAPSSHDVEPPEIPWWFTPYPNLRKDADGTREGSVDSTKRVTWKLGEIQSSGIRARAASMNGISAVKTL